MMGKKFILISSCSFHEKMVYAHSFEKIYDNLVKIDVRKTLTLHRFNVNDDIESFIEYVHSINDKADAVLFLYPDRENGFRAFLNRHYEDIPFDIIYADSYYIFGKYEHEEVIKMRTKGFLDFLSEFKQIPIYEVWERVKNGKNAKEDLKEVERLFYIYLYIGGQKKLYDKVKNLIYSDGFAATNFISKDHYVLLKNLALKKDKFVLDMVLNNICHSNLFLNFNHYKTRFSNCAESLKRLEFNGYIDIIERLEQKSYSVIQVVPEDIAYLSSFLAMNKSIPQAYDFGSFYGMMQTYVINELKRYYEDVKFIKEYNDKKIIFKVDNSAFYLNYNINKDIPLSLINADVKNKVILYNGKYKYDNKNKIYYVPFYLLSFFIKDLTNI